jgi:hypothetical protein
MPMSSQKLGKVRLSSSVTVSQYRAMESSEDRVGLGDFIEQRLLERYVLPVTHTCQKNGFLMVAASCLLIETLESFYRGRESTHKSIKPADIDAACRPSDPKRGSSKSEVAFCYFFQRFPRFSAFRPVARSFYTDVRCGILHQGETTGGWRVIRKGPMFEPDSRTLNATRFLNGVAAAVQEYARCLRSADWESGLWANFKGKMNATINHCNPA